MFNTANIAKFKELETPFYYYDLNVLRDTLGRLPCGIIKIRLSCALCHEG